MNNFTKTVENIQQLSLEEKSEIYFLLKKYLIEDRREEIYRNYQNSKKRKNWKFTNDIKELKARLN